MGYLPRNAQISRLQHISNDKIRNRLDVIQRIEKKGLK